MSLVLLYNVAACRYAQFFGWYCVQQSQSTFMCNSDGVCENISKPNRLHLHPDCS